MHACTHTQFPSYTLEKIGCFSCAPSSTQVKVKWWLSRQITARERQQHGSSQAAGKVHGKTSLIIMHQPWNYLSISFCLHIRPPVMPAVSDLLLISSYHKGNASSFFRSVLRSRTSFRIISNEIRAFVHHGGQLKTNKQTFNSTANVTPQLNRRFTSLLCLHNAKSVDIFIVFLIFLPSEEIH